MFPTTLAVGPTTTGYQNVVSSTIFGGALDKVISCNGYVESEFRRGDVLASRWRHTCKVWRDGSCSSTDGVAVLPVRASTHFRDECAVGQYPCRLPRNVFLVNIVTKHLVRTIVDCLQTNPKDTHEPLHRWSLPNVRSQTVLNVKPSLFTISLGVLTWRGV